MRAISFTHIKSSFFTHKDLLLANRYSMWTITTCPMGSVRTISIQLHLSLCRNCIVLWQLSICNTNNYQLLFSLIKTSQKLRNCLFGGLYLSSSLSLCLSFSFFVVGQVITVINCLKSQKSQRSLFEGVL